MVAGSNVDIANSLHTLGVTLGSTLSLDQHVNSMVKTCNFHLQVLRHVRQSVVGGVIWPTPWLAPSLALVWTAVIPYFTVCLRKTLISFSVSRTGQNGSCVAWVSGSKVRGNYVKDYTGCQPEQEPTSSWRHWPSSHGRRANLIISLWSFTHMNHSAVYVYRHRNC